MHFHLSLLQQAMCESKQNVQGDSSSFVRVLSVAHTRRVTARESVTPCHTLTSQNSHSEFGQAFNPLSCLPWVAPNCWKAPECCGMLQHGMHVAHRACLRPWRQQRGEQTRWQVWLWWSCPWGSWWRHSAAPTGVLGRDAKAVNSKTLPSRKWKEKKTNNQMLLLLSNANF